MLGLSLLPLAADSLAIPVPVLLYALAISLLSQQEESAAKPSVVAVVMLGILLAGLSLFLLGSSHSDSTFWPTLVLLSGCGFLLHNLWQTYRAFTPAQVKGSVRILILSMIPLDALLVMYLGPLWGAPIVLVLLLLQKMLMKSMDIT